MNKILTKILDFYIQSSIHVALSVCALVRVTLLELHLPYDDFVVSFSFFGALVGYNFIKYNSLLCINYRNTIFIALLILSFFSFVLCGYYFFQLSRTTQIFAVLALLLTIAYTVPFGIFKKNMRNTSGVKIYIVALCWALVTVVLPVLNSGFCFTILFFIYCIQRFLFVFVLMLVFEIVDQSYDDLSLQTIPQQIGVTATKKLGYLFLLFCCFINIFLWYELKDERCFTESVFFFFLIAVSLFFSSRNRTRYYTSFWVEAIPIFYFLIKK